VRWVAIKIALGLLLLGSAVNGPVTAPPTRMLDPFEQLKSLVGEWRADQGEIGLRPMVQGRLWWRSPLSGWWRR
jgi:hypothetical protein